MSILTLLPFPTLGAHAVAAGVERAVGVKAYDVGCCERAPLQGAIVANLTPHSFSSRKVTGIPAEQVTAA
jgi:hypothetical protein